MEYEYKTTFWNDFTIADKFGLNAIQDTFNRAFNEWKTDYVYLTDLVMVLNHKLWEHYEAGNNDFAVLYDKLWKEADEYACKNLKDEEAEYYFRVTD